MKNHTQPQSFTVTDEVLIRRLLNPFFIVGTFYFTNLFDSQEPPVGFHENSDSPGALKLNQNFQRGRSQDCSFSKHLGNFYDEESLKNTDPGTSSSLKKHSTTVSFMSPLGSSMWIKSTVKCTY